MILSSRPMSLTLPLALLLAPMLPWTLGYQLKNASCLRSKHCPTLLRLTPHNNNEPTSTASYQSRSKRIQHRDVVIVGGGLAGLSAALYLTQLDPSRHVTILDRELGTRPSNADQSTAMPPTTVASLAAAGMLAPQSERLPKGDLLDLCVASRRMYPDFVDLVESMARESGDEGAPYMFASGASDSGAEPWNVGFMASGGFLAPAFAGDSVATWSPPEDSGQSMWLDATQVRELEPQLHHSVVGGWWFPEDASVDARRLTCSLRAACIAAGVQFLHGSNFEVTSLDLADGVCQGLWIQKGSYIAAKSVLVANGAWMRNLLPVPIEPHKGQSLSLRMPAGRPPLLRRVLFAQDSYIVPKADGRIVIGATVEAGSYDAHVTPAGLLHVLTHALELVPALKDLPIEETWVGLRPTTPDKGPILGKTPWKNLFLAGGYWRNGVLLAPKTGQLLASLMCNHELNARDSQLLDAFAWDRFTSPGGSRKLAANARYAAHVHPIQRRASGSGVSAAVGTELGSYSSARSAAEERQQARRSLWDGDGDNDFAKFERAANQGKEDGSAYLFGNAKRKSVLSKTDELFDTNTATPSHPAEGVVATSFPSPSSTESQPLDSSIGIQAAYKTILENKLRKGAKLEEHGPEIRADPGHRIYYVDPATDEKHEVPPFTSPGDFFTMLETKRPELNGESLPGKFAETARPTKTMINGDQSNYNESTYDGYTIIQHANGRGTRQEELEAMRQARQANRVGLMGIDESKIGAEDKQEDSDYP